MHMGLIHYHVPSSKVPFDSKLGKVATRTQEQGDDGDRYG